VFVEAEFQFSFTSDGVLFIFIKSSSSSFHFMQIDERQLLGNNCFPAVCSSFAGICCAEPLFSLFEIA